MANPSWPSTLPRPVADSTAKYEPAIQPVAVTNMDSGAPKLRKRVTSNPEKFSGTLKLTGAQYATLQTFYWTTLKCVGAFDWEDFRSGNAATYVFLEEPSGQFIQGQVDRWLVSLSLLKAP